MQLHLCSYIGLFLLLSLVQHEGCYCGRAVIVRRAYDKLIGYNGIESDTFGNVWWKIWL